MVQNRNMPAMLSGECAMVEAIDGSCLCSKRLADMGFVQGTRVEMLRPGSPCIVRVNGTCIGLGAEHQRCIQLCTI